MLQSSDGEEDSSVNISLFPEFLRRLGGEELLNQAIMVDPNAEARPEEIQGEEELRAALVQARAAREQAIQERDARGQQRTERGIVLKLKTPSLDDFQNYKLWKKKMRIWKGAVKSDNWTDKQMATAVIAMIHDDHKMKKGLQTALISTMTEDECDNPTMAVVEKFLESQLGSDEQVDIYETFKTFIACEIKPGELYTDFTTRWDTTYKTLIQKDSGMKFPDKALSLMIRGAAKLSDTAHMNVRANLKFDGDNVYQDTVKLINSICQGQTSVGPKAAQVKLCTAEGEHTVRYEAGCFMLDGQEMITKQEHAVLVAAATNPRGGGGGRMSRKDKARARAGRAGRGAGQPRGEGGQSQGEGEKKDEHTGGARPKGPICFNCGKAGHIAAHCKELDDEGHATGHECFDQNTYHEFWKLEDNIWDDSGDPADIEDEVEPLQHGWMVTVETDPTPASPDQNYASKGLLGSARPQIQVSPKYQLAASNSVLTPVHNNLLMIPDDEDEDEVFMSRPLGEIKTFTAEASGAGGLDTCCSRTIMGEIWFEDYKDLLSAEDRKLIVGPMETAVRFMFGDGGKLRSRGKYYIPVEIHGHKVKLAVELVESDIPLLISKTTMTKAAMVLDMAERKTTVFGVTRKMEETSLGHPIVSVIPTKPDPFAEDILFTQESSNLMQIKSLAEMEPEVWLTQLQKKARDIPEDQQRKMIRKVHAQAGHMSGEKLKYFLSQSSIIWDKKVMKEELEKLARECEGCILKKKKPPRPVACIPVCDGFNQCVGVDLKINHDGTIILYVIDMWSKLLQARFVKSKRSADIVAALLECWISVYGSFSRTIHDNGGEFIGRAFKEMCDLLGIQDGTSGAHSPWSCGIVEIHHAVTDRTYEALRRDFPHYRKEILLQWAVMIKNSMPSATGWSPFQAVYGKNPQLPSLMSGNLAGMREEVTTKELMENMNALAEARVKFNQALCDNSLSKMLKAKIRRNQTVFYPGDKVYWRSPKNVENWRQGKVLQVDNKVMWIRDGTDVYRSSTDMAIKAGEQFDKKGKLVQKVKPDKKLEEDSPMNRTWKYSIDEEEDHARVSKEPERLMSQQSEPEAEDDDAFRDDPPAEMRSTAAPQSQSQSDRESLRPQEPSSGPSTASPDQHYATEGLHGSARPQSQVSPQFDNAATNSTLSEGNQATDDMDQDQEEDTGAARTREREEITLGPDRTAERTMLRTETAEETRRYQTRAGGKRKHDQTIHSSKPAKVKRPTKPKGNIASTGPRLGVKVGDVIIHAGRRCKVTQRMKLGGQHYNYYNLEPEGPGDAFSIDLQRAEYQMVQTGDRDDQVLVTMQGDQQQAYMAIIPYHQHGSLDCIEAKKEEIAKIVEKFDAVEVVEDQGQFRISCRFVLWYKKHSDGTIQTRARLVARGFEEHSSGQTEDIPSDSPTLEQGNMKLILALAQASGMKVITADVKSAFLQGLPLTERDVLVTPPPEAKVPKGKLWKLKVALYGLDDASLRFHWKAKQVFEKLGLKQSRYDPALFYAVDSKGAFIGAVGTHVDDFLIVGQPAWQAKIVEKIKVHFLLGKVEEGDFLYCGHRVRQQAGQITLDQREYAADIHNIVIAPDRKKQDSQPVTDVERKQIRAAAGKLGWIARSTRPDLIRAQVEASSQVSRATVSDLKAVQKAVARVNNHDSLVMVPTLPKDISQWKIQLYTDASWQNLQDGGSTAGRVVFLSGNNKSFAIFWASNRIRRVCHSSQSAEIMALNTGLGEAAYIQAMIKEITGQHVEMEAVIDNANAHSALTSNVAPTDKKVRLEAASVRDALREGELKRIKLVRGANQLADPLTKNRADCTDLLRVVQTGVGVDILQLGQ